MTTSAVALLQRVNQTGRVSSAFVTEVREAVASGWLILSGGVLIANGDGFHNEGQEATVTGRGLEQLR